MKAATEGTESLAQPLQTARLDKCLVVQRLEVAELREADGMTRHFISFDGRHFVEVNRSVEPNDPRDARYARIIWQPRGSGLAFMSILTEDRRRLEEKGASFRTAD